MKRKLSLLLACMLICMAFVSCGKPEGQEPSPSPTPEVAAGPISDEEIAAIKEKAKSIVLTVVDTNFLADDLAKAMAPLLTYVGEIETLLKDPKPEDAEWIASVKKSLEGLKTTKDSIAALTPSASLEDINRLVLATCDMFIASGEKLALAPENQEENLKLSQDYLDIAKKYLDEGTDYLDILMENQPKVETPLEVYNVQLKSNLIGTPELYARFKNNGDKEIDAFSFYVESINNYGEVVKPYGLHDYSSFIYQEGVIKPGESTIDRAYWTIYGADTTKTIRIAVYKYHTTDGTTVEIPVAQLAWTDPLS